MEARRSKGRFSDNWSMEIIATVVSLASLLVITILLYIYDDQPVFHWHEITLNALVSIFATISRLSLVVAISSSLGQAKWNWFVREPKMLLAVDTIDTASRGLFGSLRLVWQMRCSAWVVIGAWAMIGIAAFDPFIQQLLAYDSTLDFQDVGVARVPFAARWSALGGTEVMVLEDYINETSTGVPFATDRAFAHANSHPMVHADALLM